MIFSELYSVYYKTVAKIIDIALKDGVTEQDLHRCVVEEAFSESVLTILPALKSGKWPLLNEDLSPVLHHSHKRPLTILEKRWLKAIADDPRLKLFAVDFPELAEVEPLFTGADYKIYDQYADGDPFSDEEYIKHFRLIFQAIKDKQAVKIELINRYGVKAAVRFYPKGFEYSIKDDKIRIIAEGCRFKYFNLGRVISCEYYDGAGEWVEEMQIERKKELTLQIIDERNALERVMLHFAHLEKRAEKVDENRYLLYLQYYEDDETEIVIRVLSFGPCVQVVAPDSFVELIKTRLFAQKECELR